MREHDVYVSSSGAMCRDCDWFYSPGCGHEAGQRIFNAAHRHKNEAERITDCEECGGSGYEQCLVGYYGDVDVRDCSSCGGTGRA